jgi:hypothetical protein
VERTIPKFGGSWPVTKLPVVPLKARKDADRIREACIEQGKLWYRVIGGLHCEYGGIARVIKDKATIAYHPTTLVEEANFVSISVCRSLSSLLLMLLSSRVR